MTRAMRSPEKNGSICKRMLRSLLFSLLFLALIGWQTVSAAQRPYPQSVDYPGCTKPSNETQAELNADVQRYFQYWKQAYVKTSNGNTPGGGYYIEADSTGDHDYPIKSNSEAHGYGMIIFALMGEKAYFDGMYNMYDKHRSTINADNMSWVITEEELAYQDGDSATDGDMDIAYALLLAHDQWGAGGNIDYLAQARRIITNGIKAGDMSTSTHRTMLGDWDQDPHSTRSSDWMADHMRAFYAATNDTFWQNAADTVYDLSGQITGAYAPATGLMPDFVTGSTPHPAAANFLESPYDGSYYYNACRYPWRISMDYAHYATARAKQACMRMVDWLKSETNSNPNNIRAGYRLNGDALPGSNYFSTAFVAPFIAAAVVDPAHQSFLNSGWNAIKNSHDGYYEDTIDMLCMLFISGNWWAPGSGSDPARPGDFDNDRDVDGSDLAGLAANPQSLEVAVFAENFGY